ncbi:MAG: beta-mannosidase [Prevotella sp.]|nr:beta-mannosidase [Prevotella sp.]
MRIHITAALLLMATAATAQLHTYPLDSTNPEVHWQVSPERTMTDAVPAVVPGTVFTAYVEAGREACPEYGSNIYEVDERKYSRPFWYRGEFRLPQPLRADQHVWLCFDNTNRYADFWFNGEKISGTSSSEKDVSGHMLRSRFDVTALYQEDRTNIIEVKIYDADQKKTRRAEGPYGVACSPSYLAGAGWDWMPYVPGRLAGITGHARVEVTGGVSLVDPWVRSYLPTNDRAELTFTTDVANHTAAPQQVTFEGTIQPGNIHFAKQVWVAGGDTAHVHVDSREVESLVVSHPRLWWPGGYGEPSLYDCQVVCRVDGQVSDSRTVRFGIRRYDYRIETNDVGRPVFQFYVNGQRIFVKGGNWGMSEYLLRCHGREYETKIRLHRDLNYNMIRLWTGCVTDDEFYDYCDEQGIMVWNDFWLYVAFNDVAEPEAFIRNARDKVRRLRNHACIALWCGANETHPAPQLDQALRMIVMEEDAGDRLYKSCSNQDGLSGSGWWKDLPPRHHFETSASNLAFNKPAYPYGRTYGYGMRSEIGMATFPQYESVRLFIPADKQWPLPTDEQLKEEDNNVWNHHFFGKEALNAGPADYRRSVEERYGMSQSLQEFCEKAQLINLEDMRGMYEAWQDKMWHDASGLLIWMSHPAYPSFVWQTYDYYYDPTGCYWGARKACEPRHIQWNCLTGSVKVVNTTSQALNRVQARAAIYDLSGRQVAGRQAVVSVEPSNIQEAFVLDDLPAGMLFIRLQLTASDGQLLSENMYWTNTLKDMDYTPLNQLAEARLTVEQNGRNAFRLKNQTRHVAFANRLRLVDAKTGERILPVIWSDNYVTLMPGEERVITFETEGVERPVALLVKPYGQKERQLLKLK